MDLFQQTIFANTILNWAISGGILVLAFLLLMGLRGLLLLRLRKLSQQTETDLDNFITHLVERTKIIFLFFVALWLSTLNLTLPTKINDFIRTAIIIASLIQAALWGLGLIDYIIGRKLTVNTEDPAADQTTTSALKLVAKIVLWSIVVLLILENITGMEVDALIASLGIGGIAVALAVQNILEDLFSSITIALDRPFVIGDFITIGDFSGTVEHIGLKSTRIRSLSGEQLVFSNADLLSSRIRNYKRMDRRRVLFNLGVTYQTPVEKLKIIPQIIRETIAGQGNTSFERAHFKSLGDFSLNFEVVYFVEVPDYNLYVETLQAINLALFERFSNEGIEFAYPTQTLYLERELQAK